MAGLEHARTVLMDGKDPNLKDSCEVCGSNSPARVICGISICYAARCLGDVYRKKNVITNTYQSPSEGMSSVMSECEEIVPKILARANEERYGRKQS